MIFCSLVMQNFVPHARVLAESLAEHHRDARLELLVVDSSDDPPVRVEPFRRISPAEAGLSREELHRRLTMYDAQALISSLKGRLLASVLARTGGPVLFIDADMLALGPLDDVGEITRRFGIVLTPHSAVPLRFRPGGVGPEQEFLRAGVFNGGFLGVSRAAGDFLHWWEERCARDCVWALDRGTALSQTWLALVPALFGHHVLRDRGVNLSGHGIGEDDLQWSGQRPWIGETPVRLFHFAGGFDPRSGELGGPRAPQWWPRANERPGLARLCKVYTQRLLQAGYDEAMAIDAGLDWAMRAAYRQGLIEAEAVNAPEPPNPFTHGVDVFTAWLSSPAWPGSGLSRYLSAVHAGRTDLRAAFPHVPGADERALLNWVASKYGHELPAGLPTRRQPPVSTASMSPALRIVPE